MTEWSLLHHRHPTYPALSYGVEGHGPTTPENDSTFYHLTSPEPHAPQQSPVSYSVKTRTTHPPRTPYLEPVNAVAKHSPAQEPPKFRLKRVKRPLNICLLDSFSLFLEGVEGVTSTFGHEKGSCRSGSKEKKTKLC